MYKPKKSKYFVFRCEGMIDDVARKYVYATWVHLDDRPDLDIKSNDEQEVKMPISLFCDDNAIPREQIKKGFVFYIYMVAKGAKKSLLIEPRKFPPITERVKARMRQKMKGYCQVLHGDNWKAVWAEWKKAGVPNIC